VIVDSFPHDAMMGQTGDGMQVSFDRAAKPSRHLTLATSGALPVVAPKQRRNSNVVK
jgi:hypothetical protein